MTAEATEEGYARIIRHPQINKGFVELKLCSGKGIETVKVTSRDKAEFKIARKAEWGERKKMTP
jgi:ribosomal protein RSM22 (predicted rRNA methylase)